MRLILIFILVVIFGLTGLGKILGLEKLKNNFDYLQLPQWFRIVAGYVEIIAVIFLIIGIWNVRFIQLGSLLLICVAIGAIIAHIRLKHSLKEILFISVLGILALITLVLSI